MVPSLCHILDLLEEIAPASGAEDWDNPGLQVGAPFQEIGKVLVCLDPTLQAIQRASEIGAHLLLTHHPLIFKPMSRVLQDAYPGNVVCAALKDDVSIVAAHTNLDVAVGGVNDLLAKIFGLQDVEALKAKDGHATGCAGLGRIGNLPRPLPFPTFIEKAKAALGLSFLRVSGRRDRTVRRIAVVGGSGGELAEIAAIKGADLLLTGDVSHHHALTAESFGLAVVDGGHFETEKAAMTLFAERLEEIFQEKDWRTAVAVYDGEKNPMQFE